MNLRNKIIVFALITLQVSIYSQNTKWNIKLSGGGATNGKEFRYMNVNQTQLEPPIIFKETVPIFGIEVSYKFFTNFYGGVYGSYSSLSGAQEDLATGASYSWTLADGMYYGLQVNYQLLPLIFEKPLRFDLYATSRIGGLYKWWESYDNVQLKENFLEAGAGLGAAINFSRKFGIFGEALGGRFYYSNFNWRAGLSFKF